MPQWLLGWMLNVVLTAVLAFKAAAVAVLALEAAASEAAIGFHLH